MPVSPTYPGVYIEELSSGVRTITGVATSITAFIGRARLGPVSEPVTVTSFADFERRFGGLGIDYPISYAVRDFFLNGGSQAIIARLFKVTIPMGADDAAKEQAKADSFAQITVDSLTLAAKSQGEWGRQLRISFDVDVSEEVRTRLNLAATDVLFNITVRLGGTTERFFNVTVTNNARRIDRVLKAESNLVQWPAGKTWSPPPLTKTKAAAAALKAYRDAPTDAAKKAAYEDAIAELEDPATQAEKKLAAALAVKPPVPSDITQAQSDLSTALSAFKGSNGDPLANEDYIGSPAEKTGLYALEKADLFNLLCIPPDKRELNTDSSVYQEAMAYCEKRRALLLVDSPAEWGENSATAATTARDGLAALGLNGTAARNAALYFPRVIQADPMRNGQLDTFVPCGIIAGLMARTDTQRGVWKAPAGIDSSLNGTQGLQVNLTDNENGILNPLGINCLRSFPVIGRIAWGARTLRGADILADEWKYIPIRRLALYIEESLFRGTQWVVFEPNDEPLWAQIRLNVGAFMNTLFRQGAFQGTTARQAYFVRCDADTNPKNDIDRGIVNILVGFAPLKPAEFVIIKIQQIAGELQV